MIQMMLQIFFPGNMSQRFATRVQTTSGSSSTCQKAEQNCSCSCGIYNYDQGTLKCSSSNTDEEIRL